MNPTNHTIPVALASPPFPSSIADGLSSIEKLAAMATAEKAEIICFPESFLPGYPGMGYAEEERSAEQLEAALQRVREIARANAIAIIVPMDWYFNNKCYNLAYVIGSNGDILGYQTKNQLDPTEDTLWVPGTERTLFEINGLKFGITICHEGFRYPESVRWSAQRGAHVVFHPHFAGSNEKGVKLTEFGNKNNPYYEKAMMMRALENTIYFASVNYASQYPESASAVIAPDGNCIAHQTYGKVGVLVVDIDPGKATGSLAKRFKNELYR
jgi:5-aminopentanamidase